MNTKEGPHFPQLESLLSISIFSESNLSEGFSDTRALKVIDICKEHINNSSKKTPISKLIKSILIESLARNVGSGENYGLGYPYDVLEKIEHKLETEIDEILIYEIMEWSYNISDHEMVTIIKNKQEEYFFQSDRDSRELISYKTMSSLAFTAIESGFVIEYENLKNSIVKIPERVWSQILNNDETIEKYF